MGKKNRGGREGIGRWLAPQLVSCLMVESAFACLVSICAHESCMICLCFFRRFDCCSSHRQLMVDGLPTWARIDSVDLRKWDDGSRTGLGGRSRISNAFIRQKIQSDTSTSMALASVVAYTSRY